MIARLLILVLGVVSLFAGVFLSCQMWRYRELAEGIAWLEDRHFERATLIAVGTGGAAENSSRLGPVTAIGVGDRVLLVDAGRGVADALRNCSIPIAQPDTLLLTSLLPENTLGLDDLLLTGWNTPRTKPLRVLGPPGTRARAEAIVAAYAASVDTLATARGVASDGARLDVVEIGDGFVETRDGLTLRAAAVGDAPLPSLAYRFEANDRALVVAGTNPDPDRLAAFATRRDAARGRGLLRRIDPDGGEGGGPGPRPLEARGRAASADAEAGRDRDARGRRGAGGDAAPAGAPLRGAVRDGGRHDVRGPGGDRGRVRGDRALTRACA